MRRPLIDTESLATELGDPALRVFECTVLLDPGPNGPVIASGRDEWARAHVPGSDFLDLLEELADASSAYHFMLPPEPQFAEAMSRHGVEDGTRVVLYDRRGNAWATRVWWMLRAYGFDEAFVLDGGFAKWTREGRPTSSDRPAYPAGRFTARPRPGMLVGRDDVLAAIDANGVCIVNGLSPEQHSGEGPTVRGGRPGHIPGSVNVPVASLVDPETQQFLPDAELRARFERVGATDAERVITYCGGGIAASGVAFALSLLGHADVAVYDASLEEWATDPALPIETGP